MAKAFKCDMTGKILEGEGISRVDTEVPGGVLRVTFYVKTSTGSMESGVVCPEVQARIKKAIEAEFGVPAALPRSNRSTA